MAAGSSKLLNDDVTIKNAKLFVLLSMVFTWQTDGDIWEKNCSSNEAAIRVHDLRKWNNSTFGNMTLLMDPKRV